MRESRMMRKYQVRFGERSRETRSLRDEKVRSAPTRPSPILANIYLHEFDLFMKGMKEQFNTGAKRKLNKNYLVHSNTLRRLSRTWNNLKRKGASKKELREVRQEIKRVQQQRRKLPSGDPFDRGYKRLHYCRYADDYVSAT